MKIWNFSEFSLDMDWGLIRRSTVRGSLVKIILTYFVIIIDGQCKSFKIVIRIHFFLISLFLSFYLTEQFTDEWASNY